METVEELRAEVARVTAELVKANADLDALFALLETKPDAAGPKEAAVAIHNAYGSGLNADEIEERYRIHFNSAARYREIRSVVTAYERLT